MSVEAGVAIVSAVVAGSVALLAFGLDSLIELVSAMYNRLPVTQVLVETAAGASFGCVLLVLHFLVH